MQRRIQVLGLILTFCGALFLPGLPAVADGPVNYAANDGVYTVTLSIGDLNKPSEVRGSAHERDVALWTMRGTYYPASRMIKAVVYDVVQGRAINNVDGYLSQNNKVLIYLGSPRVQVTLEPVVPAPTATLDLPGKITILHTEQLLWPSVLTLSSRDGSIGHYAGQSVQGYPLTANVQLLSDGSVILTVDCKTNGFSGTYRGQRKGNVVEGQYTASSGFGGGYFKATFE